MARIKNRHIYATPQRIKELKEEYDWMGTWVTQIDPLDSGHLIVYAVPPKRRSKKKADEAKDKQHRGPRKGNGHRDKAPRGGVDDEG